MSRLLTAEQKDDRVSICTDFRDRDQNDPNFMPSVITGSEFLIYVYEPETKNITISTTEESAAGEVQYQEYVDCDLRY